MNLPPTEVHVWLAFDHDAREPRRVAEMAALLDSGERERLARLRTTELRHQFLLTRALTRTVLSAYATDVAPGAWGFASAAHGKPMLAPPFAGRGLHFNIAHTAGLVTLAVAREPAVGIDVENLAARAARLKIAERYFSANETAALAALPAGEQARRFFALWTLKESWLKATGRGLADGLGNVSFALDPGHAALSVAFANDAAGAWRFWQAQPSADHVLALALRTASDAGVAVQMRRWAPGLPVEPECLAAPRPLGARDAPASGQEQRAQA